MAGVVKKSSVAAFPLWFLKSRMAGYKEMKTT